MCLKPILQTMDGTGKPWENGSRWRIRDGSAVEQAKVSRLEEENSILSLRQQLKTMETQLCTLIGWPPRAIDRRKLNSQVFQSSLTLGVPLRLLENRPDVRRAEYAVRSTRLLMTHSEGRSYLEVLTAQQSLLAA